MLKRSNDAKVTNLIRVSNTAKGVKYVSNLANSFGLPSGLAYSCPGATSVCQSVCYAGKLERLRPAVRNVLMHNWEQLRDANYDTMFKLLSIMIRGFDAECDEKGAEKLFRIHWDGDFFNDDYTQAWGDVVRDNPQIRFWVYTRTEKSAIMLDSMRLDNLALYFSTDSDNKSTGESLAMNHGIKLAYLADTFDNGKSDMNAMELKSVRCPENNKAIKIIDEGGSACIKCGACVFGRNNVLFSATKK